MQGVPSLKIAIQGERGSFSHEAALQMVPSCTVVPCARSAEVFASVLRKRAQAAVIPIENTLAGPVTEHFDLLLEHPLFIQREHRLRIRHNLIAAPGTKLADVRRVLSHPVALDQCRNFFREHLDIQQVPFYDTAGSVKHVTEHSERDAAGIASKQAAIEYHAKILKAGIEDDPKNFTRFFLITPQQRWAADANKTSIVFSVPDEPGALFKSLAVFALRDISLSKIESRPVKGLPWHYVFYVDLKCGQTAASENALRHLREICPMVKILGIYKAGQ
ncbi:MAG: prephenate dehydratase [Acidobacteria bacterium]|nr:prephenate dehydratase [Acidobacteriota bacterium]